MLKLDGGTSISKRQKLVKLFNDPAERQFVFLLSSKAGGCGLNLIGGNRLVLFDPDWRALADMMRSSPRVTTVYLRLIGAGFCCQVTVLSLQHMQGRCADTE